MPISLNVPIPGRVKRLASDLEPELYGFERVRRRHTLVVKRFGERTPTEYARLVPAVRRAIEGTAPFEVGVTGIETFERPTHGADPVVHLAVESPGLLALHDRLCEAFEPIEGLEDEAYVPHVTLARGGSAAARERLRAREIDPVTWTVNELVLWDATHEEVAARFPLPA